MKSILDLKSMDLSHTHLNNAQLKDTDLKSSLLIGADLRGADLRGADLRGSNLTSADLSYAQLQGAKFNYACLDDSLFYQSDLSHADFRKAQISKAHFVECVMDHALFSQYPYVHSQRPVKAKRMVINGSSYRVLAWNTHLQNEDQLDVESIPITIFFHGMTGHAIDFDMIASQLDHVIYAIDLPGHGESHAIPLKHIDIKRTWHEVLEVLPSWQQTIENLSVICDRLTKKQPFHLLGYSMGARVALALACYRQQTYADHNIQHVHLVSASSGLKTLHEKESRLQHDQQWIDMLQCDGIKKFLHHWTQQTVLSLAPLDPVLTSRFTEQRVLQDPFQLACAFHILGLGAMDDCMPMLSQLEMLCSLYVGSLDQKFIHRAQEIKAHIKQCSYYEFDQAGHAILYENPRVFLAHYLESCQQII